MNITIDDLTFTVRCNNNKYYTCTITFMENDTYLLTILNSAGKFLYKTYTDTSCGLTDEEFYDDIDNEVVMYLFDIFNVLSGQLYTE